MSDHASEWLEPPLLSLASGSSVRNVCLTSSLDSSSFDLFYFQLVLETALPSSKFHDPASLIQHSTESGAQINT